MNRSLLVSAFTVFCWVASGCGGKPAVEKTPSANPDRVFTDVHGAETEIGRRIRLRVVPAMKDHSDYPDLESAPVVDSTKSSGPTQYDPTPQPPVSISGNRIALNRPILLTEKDYKTPRALFIIIDEYLAGERIVQAFHIHQKEDVNQNRTYPVQRTAALKDGTNRVWYIPLTAALDRPISDADASDLHSITLDLEFENRGAAQVHLSIRVQGVLPPVKLQTTFSPEDIRTDQDIFLMTHSRPSFFPARLSFRNPSNRTIKVWIKVWNEIALQSKLLITYFTGQPHATPTGTIDKRMSSGNLEVTGLEVFREVPGSQPKLDPIAPVQTRKWAQISLGPHESIEVRLKTQPLADTPICRLPAPVLRTFNWTSPTTVKGATYGGGGRDGGGRETEDRTVMVQLTTPVWERWQVIAARLGGLELESWVSDLTLAEDELEADRGRFYPSNKNEEARVLRNRLQPLMVLEPASGAVSKAPSSADSSAAVLPGELFAAGDTSGMGDLSPFPCMGVFPNLK